MKRILLIALFMLMVFPIYFMFIGGFQNMIGIMKMPPNLVPFNFTLGNYGRIFTWPLLVWFRNTAVVVVLTVTLTVMISSMTGYAFAFYSFRYKEFIWSMLLLGIMIPRISMIIPTFVTVRYLGLSGSLLAVILPIVYYPVGIYLARTYFATVPVALLESARLDGANEFQILIRIVMPMSRPIITCLALFAAINALNDYIWQMLVLQREDSRTLLVGMIQQSMVRGTPMEMAGGAMNPLGIGLAVASILLIPMLMIFLLANRYFTQSIGGAVKE